MEFICLCTPFKVKDRVWIRYMDNEKIESTQQPKKLFGKGVYGSKDVPIRILDKLIAVIVVVIIAMVILFTMNGGYYISFNTDGGTEISTQKIKYGELVIEPAMPIKAGYTLEKWVTSDDETLAEIWDFAIDEVVNDMTLYAIWIPADVTVKFDLDGGTIDGNESIDPYVVVYGEVYGLMPEPTRDGYAFEGWMYSGECITEGTIVTMTGEHVLTACWSAE